MAAGSQAVPFLNQQSAKDDWRRKWLAKTLLGRIQRPQVYAAFEAEVKKTYELLTQPETAIAQDGTVVKWHSAADPAVSVRMNRLRKPVVSIEGEDGIAFLIESVVWNKNEFSPLSIASLGLSKKDEAIEPLNFSYRSSKDLREKEHALLSLSRLHIKRADDLLINIFNTSTSISIQFIIIDFFQQRGIGTIPILEEFLKVKNDTNVISYILTSIEILKRVPTKPNSGALPEFGSNPDPPGSAP